MIRLVTAAVLIATTTAPVFSQSVGDFFNILSPSGADPWVLRHDDGWYYSVSSGRGGVQLKRSRTISALGGGESRVVWRPEPGQPYSHELWAPELHRLRGGWYIYVAADDGRNEQHRMYVLENLAADPFEGSFVFKGKIAVPDDDRWAIDGTVLRLGETDAERLFFVWSGWEGDVNVDQRLYIAPMSDPTTISGPRVELSRPTYDWEKAAGPPTINEGPQVLTRGDRVFLVYSAAGSWSDHYCLGMLSLKSLQADPLDPKSWSKSPSPVFQGGNGVVAPGHGSFTKSPDGLEDWFVYHAARRPGSGWSRSVRAQPFAWDAAGVPVFGKPVSPDRPIPLPSGEPKRLRLEAEKAHLQPPARTEADPDASAGARVTGLAGRTARVRFLATVEKAGTYVVAVRYRLGVDSGRSSASLLVDGRPGATIVFADSGGRWSNAFARVPLRAGPNRLTLAPGERSAEIDCLDVVLDPIPLLAP